MPTSPLLQRVAPHSDGASVLRVKENRSEAARPSFALIRSRSALVAGLSALDPQLREMLYSK